MLGTIKSMQDFSKLHSIRSIFFDVDGIMTDGSVQLREDGEWVRRFCVRDGEGIRALLRRGFHVGVITGARSGDVIARMEFLGIPHVYRGISDKWEVFERHLQTYSLDAENFAYMGDDIFDLPVLEKVGFSVSVPFAVDSVLERVDYITKRPGGHGAVRELCDLVCKYSQWGLSE